MKDFFFFLVISRSSEWREGSCSDGTLFYGHLGGIQVSGVRHGSGVVAVVPVFDDGVKEFSKNLRGTGDRVDVVSKRGRETNKI